jgi:hypothetical protein
LPPEILERPPSCPRAWSSYTVDAPDASVYATCTARDWSFCEPLDESLLEMPETGVVDESNP